MSQEDITATDGQEPADQTNDDAVQDAQDASQSGETTDPEVLARELSKARKSAGKYRTERNALQGQIDSQAAQIKAIAAALGIESDEPDAMALTSELENVRLQLRQERLTNRFTSIAASANADADLTLAYLSHRGQLADLDPEASDFADVLRQRITDALEANPKLRATAPPAQGGAEFGSGNNNGATRSMDDIIRGGFQRTPR